MPGPGKLPTLFVVIVVPLYNCVVVDLIFMSKTYVVTGMSRELMIFDKQKLYQIGGTRHDDIKKWAPENKGPKDRSHVAGSSIAPSTAGGH